MSVPIRSFFFDLGGVLLFFSRSKMIQQIATCTGLAPPAIAHLIQENGLQLKYESGFISTEEICEIFQKEAKRNVSLEELTSAYCHIFSPNLPLWDLLRQIKQKDVQLILLSNTNEAHFEYVKKHFPILSLFNDFVLSYQVHSMKPNPEIFFCALRKACCSKEEVLYVDDLIENVEAAKKLSIDSHQYTELAQLKEKIAERSGSLL